MYSELHTTYLLQVGLREKSDGHGFFLFRENDGVFAQPHRAGLEAIAVMSNRLDSIDFSLIAVTKANERER